MKKTGMYRVGAAFLAAVMMITCMPQTGLYAMAQEEPSVISEEPDEAGGEGGQQMPEQVPAPAEDSVLQPKAPDEGGVSPLEEDPPDTPEPIPVTSISLDKTEISMVRNQTAQLTGRYVPSNATEGNIIKFESENDEIAAVSYSDGVATITAKKAGNVRIKATAGTTAHPVESVFCQVTVTPILVTDMTVTMPKPGDTLEMKKGETAKLQVVLVPADADDLTVTVRNTDSNAVTAEYANNELTVKAVKSGRAVISVKANSNPKVLRNIPVAVDDGEIPLTGLSTTGVYQKNLSEGYTVNLKKYVVFNPDDATDKELVWSVSGNDAAKYAEVDQKGNVTAKWENAADNSAEKEVTIIAASKNNSTLEPAKFTIKIKRNNVPLEKLFVERETMILEDGGDNSQGMIFVRLDPLTSTDREITATVSEKNGKTAVMVNGGSIYKKDEAGASATATADAFGRAYFTVSANALEGSKKQDTCTITFTRKGDNPTTAPFKVQCQVTVNKYVTSVSKLTLSDKFHEIADQGTAELTAVIEPSEIEDTYIIWTVSDPEIASITALHKDGSEQPVPADGRVKAELNAENKLAATVKITANMVGKCDITATASGNSSKKETCQVTVTNGANPAKELTISSKDTDPDETTEIVLKMGQTYRLVPNVTVETPGDPANKKVKWTSNSPEVASVTKGADEAGLVTANELGECIITAQASGEDEACKKEVKVYVKNPVIEVKYKGTAPWKYTPDDQPITEEMLRKELEVLFYPREIVIPEKDVQTLGSGEENDYVLKILKDDKKTEKIYTPEDMVKPGTKTLVISYTYEEVTYKGTVAVTMEAFTNADLISVTPLSGEDADIWNVPNGTSALGLPLPKTAEITVGRVVTVEGKPEQKTSRMDVGIDWKTAESDYDPFIKEAQEFDVFGEVVLPEYIKNPNSVSTRVKAKVHVREAASSGKKMARPIFSVMGGNAIGDRTAVTLPYGSKIEISPITEAEDAEIYYMIDRRPNDERGIPHDEAHRYKSPIEVTYKTTTIYAIAAKSGYDDSDCSECTIKLVEADPIDPDDPNAGPLPDDVTEEDRAQIGGKVPDGLWAVVQKGVAEQDGFAYTGNAIKPAVRVYDRTMLLTEKKDYTIAYKNNINAGSAEGSANPPTITVTGKGNYEGKAVVHFTIKPQKITDDSVLVDSYLAVAYNKNKAQKPNPSLTWNGKKLVKNKDYTYTDTAYTEPGIYKFTVTGIGNYEGTRMMDFEIYQGGVSASKFTVSKIPNQKYTGSRIEPPVTVKYKNTVLVAGTEQNDRGNYWIKYENCTNVGTASVVIVGKGNYHGSKRINFKIQPVASISKAGITLTDIPAAGVSYTGKAYTPKCSVNYNGQRLTENRDYKLSYQNNIKAGTATVVVTGMGAYNGTAKKTFKILQNDISSLNAVMAASYVYEKGGCKPKPEITCDGIKLAEGMDYTLTYKDNNKIGNTACVTIKGKGNYKGKIVRYFAVTMQDISNLKVVANDKVYQRKKNIYKTSIQVIDKNGKALKAGTDYSKDIYYTYESDGRPVLATDIIPAGTVIGVDIRVANPNCYHGSIHGTYRIVQADISTAKVSINPQEYTGRSIRLKKSQIQVTIKGMLLGSDDYEIVGYENNVNQGNAKITIRGVGGYGGTKTATFKIKKKGILNLKF